MTLTVHIPNRKINLGDRVLRLLGKERRPILPHEAIQNAYTQLGHSVYVATECHFESFWSALIRPRKSVKVNEKIG